MITFLILFTAYYCFKETEEALLIALYNPKLEGFGLADSYLFWSISDLALLSTLSYVAFLLFA